MPILNPAEQVFDLVVPSLQLPIPVLSVNYFLPGDHDQQFETFAENRNHLRCHECFDNKKPAASTTTGHLPP